MNKYLLYFIVLLCFVSQVRAQNLVINPSFETFAPCPVGPSELENATSWTQPYVNLVGDTCSTSDLYNACSPLGSMGVGVPSNILGSQVAHTGDGYAGIIVYEGFALTGCSSFGGSGWREYVQGELSAPLVAGTEYCVSFYVSLADNVKWGSNNIGVYFSNTQVAINCGTVGAASDLPYTPQLVYSGPDLNDVNNWTLIQMNYVAAGGETYIVIGNFEDNAGTTYFCSNAAAFNPYAYYYIDDVSVEAGVCLPPCEMTIVATASVCDPADNTYSVSGTVDVLNAPSTGTMSISLDGDVLDFAAPFASSTAFSFTGLISDGVVHNVVATFSDDALCTYTYSYLAPVNCTGTACDIVYTTTSTNVSCFGLSDGSATVNVSAPSAGLTYVWSHDAANTTNTAADLAAGTYTCTVSTSGGTPLLDQTIWQDDFDGALNWNLTGAVGSQGANANQWIVDDLESWDGVCGSGNLVTPGDKTMHVYCDGGFFCTASGTGAVYDAGGTPFTVSNTDKYAATISNINTTGYTNIRVQFAYRCMGDLGNDYGSFRYSIDAGLSWIDLPATYVNQNTWDCVSVTLPATCENIPSLKIAYRWRNNDDGIGTDPSFAIDDVIVIGDQNSSLSCSEVVNITISQPTALVANAGADQTICSGQDAIIGEEPTGGAFSYTYTWAGGLGATQQITVNPTTTTTYTVEVTDINGCIATDEVTVTVAATTTLATFTYAICEATTYDLTSLCGVGCTCSYYTDAALTTPVSDPSLVAAGSYFISCDKIDCDEIQPVVISSNPNTTSTLTSTLCLGQSITVADGTIYTPSADTTIIETIGNYHGCDSIITREVTIVSSFNISNDVDICNGDNITINGNTYMPSVDTTVIDNLISSAGCDSMVSTHIALIDCSTPIFFCGGNIYHDANANGSYDCGEVMYDGITLYLSESFTDVNANGTWDSGETYIDANANGTWDLQYLSDISSTTCDETYTDANGNCMYDIGETFVDIDGDSYFDCQTTYLFTDLIDGNYVISIDESTLPTGMSLTSVSSIPVTLDASNNVALQLDFTLPIEMLYFHANGDCASATLTWQLASNTDHSNYTLQRSYDGYHFEDIAGYAFDIMTATYTDHHHAKSDVYYRLRYNHAGSSEYSQTQVVELQCEKSDISIYPNPVLDLVTVDILTDSHGKSQLTLLDITGKTLYLENIYMQEGRNKYNLPMTTFANGIYYLGVKDLVNGRFDYYKIVKTE